MSAVTRRRFVVLLTALVMLSGFLRAVPAQAAEEVTPVDRAPVVTAWQMGGTQVRAAAEAALVGSDAQIREFLDGGWQKAQQLDERDAVAKVISEGGPSMQLAAKRALEAADAGQQGAIAAFLANGWQGSADSDTRLSVNQFMATGGEEVRAAAQRALNSRNPDELRAFLDSGWQVHWHIDQRLRVNQAMATGGTNVKAAAQAALDARIPEALEAFLEYGWAVGSARDEETATLSDLLAQAQAAGELAAQETQNATHEADRARAAADAAGRAARDAAKSTADAQHNTAQAAAHARRAAVAADQAAKAAQVAVQAAAAASRAARAAATAAARAASAASRAGRAATTAYKAAAEAASDEKKAPAALKAAEDANKIASEARTFADKVEHAGKAIQAGMAAIDAAKSAATHARAAADSNNEAVRHARNAGANASEAVSAANRARDNADRAVRAAEAAERYLRVAIEAAFASRDAARRAADNAEAAARAAIDAANHAGIAAEAARRATEYANAATVAAQAAVDAGIQAAGVYEAARVADAERLAVAREQGQEAARAASVLYQAQQRIAAWDLEQAAQRDAETSRLITEAQNPATAPAAAVVASRKVAIALASARGPWTQQDALAALAGSDDEVLTFVRTGLAASAARDDRHTVRNVAITDNPALAAAAMKALEGDDAAVREFLRTQDYPDRYIQDRLRVNQIQSAAREVGDLVVEEEAQKALNKRTLQALRDFLDRDQYTAAAIGDRVRVNQILADRDSGPELKAAAQIALDGPPIAQREFLTTGRYTAAQRDYDSAIHLDVVGGLLEKINQVAEKAVQDSLTAQAMAARARGDAERANTYANEAGASAERAATYAAKAQTHANNAAKSVEKATAAVATAKNAATRANASARSAIRSAAWAINSHQIAVQAAAEANASALRARDSAIAAGATAEAAKKVALAAYDIYEKAKGTEIQRCHVQYAAGPAPDLERLLGVQPNEWNRICVANVLADHNNLSELAVRAYKNSAFCSMYPQGSTLYQNCIQSTLDPTFRGMQPLIILSEAVKGMIALLAPAALALGALCVATLVCGAVAGTLLTIGEVGLNIHRLINGDQSLANSLLNLGKIAIESLLLAGVGKMISTGFRNIRALNVAVQNLNRAQTELQTVNFIRLALTGVTSCVRQGLNAQAPVGIAFSAGSATRSLINAHATVGFVRSFARAAVGTAVVLQDNTESCKRLVLGIERYGEALASHINGITFNSPSLQRVTGLVNGVPYALWMHAVNDRLKQRNAEVAVALDGFDGMKTGTVEEAKTAFLTAYRKGAGKQWRATEWEMYRIGFYCRLLDHVQWENIDFYFGKDKIELPEPIWDLDPAKVRFP
ncbi:MAG TPA: ALF repeat-containing protein [Micromonosporaceae bacterium]|nr:ALF repeat-containing protein [Micromonosporaceae bacterium]